MTSKTIPPEDEIDEVARAILRSEYDGPLPVWEGLSPFAQESYRKNAHAAISVLQSRQPDREAIIGALALAETIIRQLPENGKNWNTISRFWAAVSSLKHSDTTPEAKRESMINDELYYALTGRRR